MFEDISDQELKAVILAVGQTRVCKESKVSSSTLNDFVNIPDREIRTSTRQKIIKALKKLKASEIINSNQSGIPDSQAVLSIPIYDIRASAGAGALAEDGEPTGFQPYRESELARYAHEYLAVIQVGGDSMWETLHDGDKVLVNRAETRIVRPGIYILGYEGQLIVKRCQRNLETGAVIVASDNPDYETFVVKDPDVLDVIGRVVWIGRALG